MKLPKKVAFGSGGESETQLKRRFVRRMLFRLFVCVAFYAVWHPVASHFNFFALMLPFLLIFVPGLIRDFIRMRRAKDLSKYWAQQREDQEISTMTGKNADELERMIDWNMKKGNVTAADRLSQQLLSIVDCAETNASASVTAPIAAAQQGSADATAQETSGGLPDWMRDGAGDGSKKLAESEDNKLPDWIKG